MEMGHCSKVATSAGHHMQKAVIYSRTSHQEAFIQQSPYIQEVSMQIALYSKAYTRKTIKAGMYGHTMRGPVYEGEALDEGE